MRRTKTGYTAKQYAYAHNTIGAIKDTKKERALAVGYSNAVATSVKVKIENTEGYANAMSALASENGNVALKIYYEMKNRDLSKVDFDKLLQAITTLANAWSVYTPKTETEKYSKNKLRAIVLNRIENQTINNK